MLLLLRRWRLRGIRGVLLIRAVTGVRVRLPRLVVPMLGLRGRVVVGLLLRRTAVPRRLHDGEVVGRTVTREGEKDAAVRPPVRVRSAAVPVDAGIAPTGGYGWWRYPVLSGRRRRVSVLKVRRVGLLLLLLMLYLVMTVVMLLLVLVLLIRLLLPPLVLLRSFRCPTPSCSSTSSSVAVLPAVTVHGGRADGVVDLLLLLLLLLVGRLLVVLGVKLRVPAVVVVGDGRGGLRVVLLEREGLRSGVEFRSRGLGE